MSDTSTGVPAHRRVKVIRRETRPIKRNLTWATVLLVAFAIYTWLAVAWSPFLQLDDFLNRNFRVHSFWPLLHVVDRIGQRAVCLPILAIVMGVVAWRHRSWRPVVLGVAGVFVINLLVLIVKLALARGRPLSGGSFFSESGEQVEAAVHVGLYPSGHTANILVVYGICCHLITYYGVVSSRVKNALIAAVSTLSVIMVVTSLLLRWHWFSDLIGGFLVGGAVLVLAVGIDAAVPFRSSRMVVTSPAPPDEEVGSPPSPPGSRPRAGAPQRSLSGGGQAGSPVPRERIHSLQRLAESDNQPDALL